MAVPDHLRARASAAMSAFLVLLVAIVILGCSGTGSDDPGSADVGSPAVGQASLFGTGGFDAEPPSEWVDERMRLAELPPEALETLDLIAVDGPFPYRQDGSTFQNREGLLPKRPVGHYQEFTVETPGSPDRGARRFVVGDGTEVYYTEDHYASFRYVVP